MIYRRGSINCSIEFIRSLLCFVQACKGIRKDLSNSCALTVDAVVSFGSRNYFSWNSDNSFRNAFGSGDFASRWSTRSDFLYLTSVCFLPPRAPLFSRRTYGIKADLVHVREVLAVHQNRRCAPVIVHHLARAFAEKVSNFLYRSL